MKRILYTLAALVIILASSTGQVLAAPQSFTSNSLDSISAQISSENKENPLLWNIPSGEAGEYPTGISAADDGNVYITSGNLLKKLSKDGYEQWSKPLLGFSDSQYKVDASLDGYIYVCGGNQSVTEIRKYDNEGNLLWWHSLASPSGSFLFLPAMAVDPSGNVYAAGTWSEGINSSSDGKWITLIKYDSNGKQLWTQQIGNIHWKFVSGMAAGNNHVYVLGDTLGCDNKDNSYCFLGNYSSSNGTENWVAPFGSKSGQLIDWTGDIAMDSSGNAYCMYKTGQKWMALEKGELWYMTKFDDLGKEMWTTRLDNNLANSGDCCVDSEQNVYVSLMHRGVGENGTNAYLIDKYDYYGHWKWTESLSSGIDYRPGYICIGQNDDIYFTGYRTDGSIEDPRYPFLAKFQGNKDTDEDGLLDKWETDGVTVGNTFVDLPAMGADPQHKDIFVEVDWMPTQQPKPGTFDKVIKAFLDAPVDNPDGKSGINIHIDSGPKSIMNPQTGENWGVYSRANEVPHSLTLGETASIGGAYDWSAFDKIKGDKENEGNFKTYRAPFFHYCLFADRLGGDLGKRSGIARLGGNDFIVSLGSWNGGSGGYSWQQGATFMHELGHNFGLLGDNKNPNYLSIMNYSFQFTGLYKKDATTGKVASGIFDYSRFSDINDLDENNLNETKGISSASNNPELDSYCTVYWSSSEGKFVSTDKIRPINWDGDGNDSETVTSGDINHDGMYSYDPPLKSFDDWANLKYKCGSIGALGAAETPDEELTSMTEITEEEAALVVDTYRVSVTAPENSGVKPGGSSITYPFTVTNLGTNEDTYDITAASSAGWANLASVPASITLAAGASQTIDIQVTAGATPTEDQDVVTLKAVSQTFDRIWDVNTATTIIQADSMTEQQITAYTDANHRIGSVAVYGDWVVWLEGAYPSGAISLQAYNFATGTQSTIATGFAQNIYDYNMVDIYETKVVYCKSSSSGGIYLYDLNTSTETKISQTGIGPRISGDRVVYNDQGDVYLYNITSGTTQIILACGGTEIPGIGNEYVEYRFGWYNFGGDIYGDKVVSIQIDDPSWNPFYNVVVYDISEGTYSYVTASGYPYHPQNVQIYADTVVWEDDRIREDDRTNTWVVYQYDLTTGIESDVTTYTDPYRYNSYYHWPDVYNGKVVANRYNEGGTGINKIYLYDLASGSESLVVSGAWGSTGGNSFCLDFCSDRITYLKGTASQRNLYVTTLASAAETTLSTSPAEANPDGWFNTQPKITLTPDKDGVSIFYQWDGNSELGWMGYTGAFTAPEGEHTLYYYSVDALGSTESVKSYTFSIDITPPETIISTTPSLGEIIGGLFKELPAITLSTGEVGSVSYYQWDASAEGAWNTFSTAFNGVGGVHTLYYYSVDVHGVAETVQSQVFNVDTTEDDAAPTTTLSSDPSLSLDGSPFTTGPAVTLTPDETAVTYYQWDTPLDGIPETAWSYNPDTVFAPFTFGPTLYRGGFMVPKGTHTLYYFSVDASGNIEPLKSQDFTVDFEVIVSAGSGGSVSGEGFYLPDDTVILTASANPGFRFVNWTEGEAEVSTEAAYSFTATSDRALVANFVQRNGILAWWQGEDNAEDTMGNYDGTLQGSASFAGGVDGQAFDFSGNGQFVSLPGMDIQNKDSWTITAWFNMLFSDITPTSENNTYSGNATVSDHTAGVLFGMQDVGYGDTPSDSLPLIYVGTDGLLYSGFGNGSLVTVEAISEGWHQAAITYGDNVTLYLDGVQVGSIPVPDSGESMTINQIGTGYTSGWSNAADGWFDFLGQIDETALFERGLSQSEIEDIYNNGLPGRTDTSISLNSSANPVYTNKSVTFTASVTPNNGSITPTGSVEFKDGTALLGTTAIDSSGMAAYTAVFTSNGTHSIVAAYGGDDCYSGSSDTINQVVNAAAVSGGGGGITITFTTITSTTLIPSIPFKTDSSGNIQDDPTLRTEDNAIKIIIPLGSRLIDSNGHALTHLEVASVIAPEESPDGTRLITAYGFNPTGITANKLLNFIMSYDRSKLPAGMEETSLYIAYLEGTDWVPLQSEVDTAEQTVTAKINSFGTFALLGTIVIPATPTPTPTQSSTPDASVSVPTATASPVVTPTVAITSVPTQTSQPSPNPTSAPVSTPAPTQTISWGLIIGILAAIIVVFLVILFIVGKRGKIRK